MALIDTYSIIEEMVASGIKKEQAVIITKAINQSNDNLATKSDLKAEVSQIRSEISKVKHELITEISNVKHELETDISELKTDISWLKVISIANFTVLIGGLLTLWFK